MIILAGPIGSGKSEQGKRLATRLDCPWISSGQLLRDEADSRHTKVMKKGNLVSDEHICTLLGAKFKEIDAAHKEFILDGTPRTKTQAQWLIRKIADRELKFTVIILLRVSKKEIIKRLAGRGRADDHMAVIDERLKEYTKNTVAAIKYLKMEGLRIDEVDGDFSKYWICLAEVKIPACWTLRLKRRSRFSTDSLLSLRVTCIIWPYCTITDEKLQEDSGLRV